MIPLSGDVDNSKGIIDEKIESYSIKRGTSTLKRGLAHMLKNGVVMDVVIPAKEEVMEERIAEVIVGAKELIKGEWEVMEVTVQCLAAAAIQVDGLRALTALGLGQADKHTQVDMLEEVTVRCQHTRVGVIPTGVRIVAEVATVAQVLVHTAEELEW